MNGIGAKEKLALLSIGVILGLSALFIGVIKPQMKDLAGQHMEVQKQKDELSLLILEEQSYNTARADLKKIESRVEEVKALFPVKEQLVGFVEVLESIARELESDFAITITDAAEEPQATSRRGRDEEALEDVYEIVPGLSGIEVIPYDFQLSGSFLGIVQFLQTLENQPFFSEVETLTLRSDVQQIGSGSDVRLVRSGRVTASIRSAFYAAEK